MGMLRKLPAGLGAATFGSGASEFAAWASISPPGTEAANKPLVAARNSLRPIAEFLGCFFMRLLGERSSGMSTNVSAALYLRVSRKQASQIVFLRGFKRMPRDETQPAKVRHAGTSDSCELQSGL